VLHFWQDTIAALSFAGQGACLIIGGFLRAWKSTMNDLYDWLSRQHHGLRTFQLFRRKLSDLSEREPDKKALDVLLSQLAGGYVEAFDEQPVPVANADRAHERLLKVLASLDQCASADRQLADLNRVAALDLLAPTSDVDSHDPSVKPALRADTMV
jgi:hypothetical protein